MVRTLVTGGSGFIGGHLVEKLVKMGYEVTIFDNRPPDGFSFEGKVIIGDIRHTDFVSRSLKGYDLVFHLAGILGTHETMDHTILTTEVNVIGTLNVLEAARYNGFKIVDISLTNDWLNPYTITKQAAAKFCQMYAEEFVVKVALVRGLNVYGPRQHWRKVQKAVPYFIVQALKNKPLEIFGDGNQEVDLIYIEDVVDILIETANTTKCYGQVLDAGTGKKTRVNDLVKLIIKLTGSNSKIKHLALRSGEPIHSVTVADTTNLSKFLNYKIQIDLADGLKNTIKFYKDALDGKIKNWNNII